MICVVAVRIDVADPGPDGPRIAEALRLAGYDVTERTLEALSQHTDATLVVLAADARGSQEAIRTVRATSMSGDFMMILVGAPSQDPRSVLRVGAVAIYERPVPTERLTMKVASLLGAAGDHPDQTPTRMRAPVDVTVQLPSITSAGGGPLSKVPVPSSATGQMLVSVVVGEPEWGPRDPTVLLPGTGTSSSSELSSPVAAAPLPPPTNDGAVSDRLHRLLCDADRRLFPDGPPLTIDFVAGDESAEELVPDEVLNEVAVPLDAGTNDDLIDRVALLEPVGIPEAAAGGIASSAAGESSVPSAPKTPVTLTEASSAGIRERLPSRSVQSGHGHDELARARSTAVPPSQPTSQTERGALGDGDVLRLSWNVLDRGGARFVRLELVDLPLVQLTIAAGEVVAVSGPVFERALVKFRHSKRIPSGFVVQDETVAVAVLDRCVERGDLSRFELGRCIRETRQELIYECVGSRGGRFEVSGTALTGASLSPLLDRPFAQVVVEGARRKISVSRLRLLVGAGPMTLRMGADAEPRFRQAGLEPELIELFIRHEGKLLDALLASVPLSTGVAGVTMAMVAGGAIVLEPGGRGINAPRPDPTELRQAVLAAAALYDEGDYFSILGVLGDVSPRELAQAYHGRKRTLEGELDEWGAGELESVRDQAIAAMDEAFELLSDEALRTQYRRAIGH